VLLTTPICLQQRQNGGCLAREIVRTLCFGAIEMEAQVDNCTTIVELVRASPWIISAVAWPSVVFGIAWLFRREIESCLNGHIFG
jgi:hypothetical protein